MKRMTITFLILTITLQLTAPVFRQCVILKASAMTDGLEQFTNKMSLKESANDWKVVNSSGHMGLFQFSKATLKRLGYNITPDKFKKNPDIFPPELQYIAFYELLKLNEIDLLPCFEYIGTTIEGVEVTKSGLLGGCHLGGLLAVKLYLATGGRLNPDDCNGTKISDYIREFGGYKI